MKKIIVTGDSGGLGHDIVGTLLESPDYSVIGISRKENSLIDKLREKYGDRYVHINYDLKEADGIKELYLRKLKNMGPIYGLVNNAALAYDDIVSNANLDAIESMYKVNVFSPMMLTKYVIRDMLLNNVHGSIVHISSVSAHTGYKGLSMYASTKGAMEAFSKGIAREWGVKGIRSNCVAPGFMETNMSATLSSEQKSRIYARNSKKMETSLRSVSKTVEFLLSEASESITGTVIHVDNGTI